MYEDFYKKFELHHKNPTTILVHGVTITLGCIFFLSCVNIFSEVVSFLLVVLYSLSLMLASRAILVNLLVFLSLLLLNHISKMVDIGVFPSALAIGACYTAQALSHKLCNEPPYDGTYVHLKISRYLKELLVHNYYLIPSVVNLFIDRWNIKKNLGCEIILVQGKLDQKKAFHSMQRLLDFLGSEEIPGDVTKHYWYSELPKKEKNNFNMLAHAPEILDAFYAQWDRAFYQVDIIHEMNELYISSNENKMTSDNVFYRDHIDGPYGLFPFCGVYRTLLALNSNTEVCTIMSYCDIKKTLDKGDFLSFDFNREAHRIEKNPKNPNEQRRITLKLHYIVYPKILYYWAKLLEHLTSNYDRKARNLFLYTIKPTGFIKKNITRIILWVTDGACLFEKHIGFYNSTYVILCAIIFGVPSVPFLYATSFIHFIKYICVFYYRKNVSFYKFKRDAIFFKTIMMIQVLGYYSVFFPYEITSLLLVLIGLGLSGFATAQLGLDRTYFGHELGIVKSEDKIISGIFILQHPIILGSIIMLWGLSRSEFFSMYAPMYLPLSIFLYIVVLLQEIYSVREQEHAL